MGSPEGNHHDLALIILEQTPTRNQGVHLQARMVHCSALWMKEMQRTLVDRSVPSNIGL